MGNERREATITYMMSRHNSARDLRDNALAGQLLAELRAVCDKTEYGPLDITTSGVDANEFIAETDFYGKVRAALAPYVPAEQLSDAIYAVYQSGLG